VKTIVTTELIREIADNYQVPCDDVLTGFKYIAEKIENEPNKTFVVGGEESYGYLTGSFVRDKDAVSACCMIAELAAFAKDSGMTMYDWLKNLYVKYSFYQEGLLSVTKKGQAGAAEIQKMMENFRAQPPKILGGSKVVKMMDYQSSVETNLITAETKKIALPKSNVLQFFAEDGTKVTIRPSGTEPKIKFYFGVKTNLSSVEQFDNVKQQLTTKIESLKKEIVGSN
jgi:phosphoglucomutase